MTTTCTYTYLTILLDTMIVGRRDHFLCDIKEDPDVICRWVTALPVIQHYVVGYTSFGLHTYGTVANHRDFSLDSTQDNPPPTRFSMRLMFSVRPNGST